MNRICWVEQIASMDFEESVGHVREPEFPRSVGAANGGQNGSDPRWAKPGDGAGNRLRSPRLLGEPR